MSLNYKFSLKSKVVWLTSIAGSLLTVVSIGVSVYLFNAASDKAKAADLLQVARALMVDYATSKDIVSRREQAEPAETPKDVADSDLDACETTGLIGGDISKKIKLAKKDDLDGGWTVAGFDVSLADGYKTCQSGTTAIRYSSVTAGVFEALLNLQAGGALPGGPARSSTKGKVQYSVEVGDHRDVYLCE